MGIEIMTAVGVTLAGIVCSALTYMIQKYKLKLYVELNKRLEQEIKETREEIKEKKKEFEEEKQKIIDAVSEKSKILDRQFDKLSKIEEITLESKQKELDIKKEKLKRERETAQHLSNIMSYTGGE